MSSLRMDLRYAFRSLMRAPWFTAVAVLILALGIGVNAVLFSMVDAVLVRALPYAKPQELVEIFGYDASRDGMRVPEPLMEAIRARSTTVQSVAIHGPSGGVLRTPEGLVQTTGVRVSSNFFQVVGVRPVLGRGFVGDEDSPSPALVVSHAFWSRYLASDSGAIGRPIYLDGVAHTVVGVMPSTFRTLYSGTSGDSYWTTHVVEGARAVERERGYELIGRLREGASIDAARNELLRLGSSIGLSGWSDSERRLGLHGLRVEIVRDRAWALQLLLAAVIIVLAMICANLAVIVLARSDHRLHEFATRKALGADAPRLARLALSESLLLSLAGGTVGAIVAYTLLPVFVAMAPSDIPMLIDAKIDGRVLLVVGVVAITTACAFGLVPALRLSRLSPADVLKGASTSTSRAGKRFSAALVSLQVAAAVTLCALSGLIGQTFLTLLPSHPGFKTAGLSSFWISTSPREYPDSGERRVVQGQILSALSTRPGVVAVAVASNMPFGSDDFPPIAIRVAGDAEVSLSAERRAISPNYFDLMGIPLIGGRSLTSGDAATAPRVAVINETLARQLAVRGPALDQTIQLGRSAATALSYRVVGIVGDTRFNGASTKSIPEVYVSAAQRSWDFAYLIVRSDASTQQLTTEIRDVIRTVAPRMPLSATQRAVPLSEMLQTALAAPRFLAVLSSAFSLVVLLLAAVGVFGLVAYSGSRRQRELGIRAALGAAPWELAKTTVRSALTVSSAGVVAGLLAGGYLKRFVESRLYDVRPLDFATFAGAALLMVVVAALAAAIPARRSMQMNPAVALRND